MLCDHCINPVLQPLRHWLDSNVFRKEQLYWYESTSTPASSFAQCRLLRDCVAARL